MTEPISAAALWLIGGLAWSLGMTIFCCLLQPRDAHHACDESRDRRRTVR